MKEFFLKWRLFYFHLILSLVTAMGTIVIPVLGLHIDPLKMAVVWAMVGLVSSMPFAWFLGLVSKLEGELGWVISQLILTWFFVGWLLGFQDPADMNLVIGLAAIFIAFLVLGGVTIDSFFNQERF